MMVQGGGVAPGRCRANVARIRQSRPDSGFGFQVKVVKNFPAVPFLLGSGSPLLHPAPQLTTRFFITLQGRSHFYMKRELDSKVSGNEVHYTGYSLLVILKNSCSKLHYHKVLIQFPFHFICPHNLIITWQERERGQSIHPQSRQPNFITRNSKIKLTGLWVN